MCCVSSCNVQKKFVMCSTCVLVCVCLCQSGNLISTVNAVPSIAVVVIVVRRLLSLFSYVSDVTVNVVSGCVSGAWSGDLTCFTYVEILKKGVRTKKILADSNVC